MANSLIDKIFRRPFTEPEIPQCADHKIDMHMRGKIGRPARFSDTTEEQYTVIYFCPVPQCNHTAEVTRRRIQVPVPNEAPARPSYSRQDDR